MEKRSTLYKDAGIDTSLQSQWHSLVQTLTSNQDLAEEMLAEITERYTVLGRHYHTLAHLVDLLRLFHEYRDLVQDQAAVQFAIWYHDFVYDPHQSDYEALSADIASQRLHRLAVPDPIILKVKRLILATRHHTLLPVREDLDCLLFLDCDLSILGADRERYAEYMQEIRQEYIKVPLSDYSEGRKAVLQRLLERETIYLTAEFQARFEEQARDNMQFELSLLGE
jgi:predicted metal-dependent HD superfamily phosphohydrolase